MLNAPRRALLRAATTPVHRELDGYAQALDLASLGDYGRFLVANAAPLFALELALERAHVERVLPDWSKRSRRQALTADLHALALAATPMQSPAIDDVSEQLGVLYVLEGSRVGARSILKAVCSSTDPRVRGAMRFLGASDLALWSQFLQVLESVDRVDTDAMVRAANRAFALFNDSFRSLRAVALA